MVNNGLFINGLNVSIVCLVSSLVWSDLIRPGLVCIKLSGAQKDRPAVPKHFRPHTPFYILTMLTHSLPPISLSLSLTYTKEATH